MIGKHRTDGVLLIPYAGMVAAGITCQCDDGKPRFKWCDLKTELTGDAFFDAGGLDVAEDVGDDTEGKYFCQYPGWRVCVGIGLLEVNDEIFT